MNKKKNLLKLFSEDTEYHYHLVKTEEPNGHLVYVIKDGNELDKTLFEFYPTRIIEELLDGMQINFQKFAPSVFFTEEENIEKLKYELNDKFSENFKFSSFIEEIKDEYRILEIKDSLLYKKDPEAYEEAKRKEHEEHQKELWDDVIKQHEEQIKRREEALLEYDNNLFKLLQDHLKGIVEYEKRDFNLEEVLETIVLNLIDPETWIKINDNPFICRVEPISLETDRMNVFLTDNNDYSYTATLRFDKTVLVTENVVRINKGDALPDCMPDYQFLANLFEMNLSNIPEWEFKDKTDKFNYVIDHLSPIFKKERLEKEKEFYDKLKSENEDDEDSEEDDDEEDDDEIIGSSEPSNWYFDVFVDEDSYGPSSICLSEDGNELDDQLGSHNIHQNIIDALNRAGIYGDGELMESVWEVNDYENKTKEDIIKSMEDEGFIYKPNLF